MAQLTPPLSQWLPMNPARKLPDFLILGAAKAGTTALFGAVSRHPRVFCSPVKEPRFLAHAPSLASGKEQESAHRKVVTESDYLALFVDCPPGSVAGEASTEYLSSERAPAAALRYVPRARLIAVLRHPMERAFSQYLHRRHNGREPLDTFEAAWAEEERRADTGNARNRLRGRGFYAQALTRWLEVFPREQLLILFYEDWCHRPDHVLDLVWRHLGVDPIDGTIVRRENVSSRPPRWLWLHRHMTHRDNPLRRLARQFLPRSVRDVITDSVNLLNLGQSPRLDPALRARLAVVYHQDLDQLERLTGRDLTAWRR